MSPGDSPHPTAMNFDLSFVILPMIYSLCLIGPLTLVLRSVISRRNQEPQVRGCRKLGLQTQSNLADEHDAKYGLGTSEPGSGNGATPWTIKSLWIYPVKSCRGVELDQGSVVSTGMAYDRLFSFAQLLSASSSRPNTAKNKETDDSWVFITQRQYPLLTQVKTELWIPDPSSPTYSPDLPDVQSNGVVVVTFPIRQGTRKGLLARVTAWVKGQKAEKSFKVPFEPTASQIKQCGYTTEKMKIWKDQPTSLNMSSSIAAGLSSFLGMSKNTTLALFRVDPRYYRTVLRCAPRKEQLGYQPVTGFADAYPLHILNLASVQDVARRLPQGAPRLSALQFRANIIITGPRAYAEDDWKRIRIGGYEYYASCRTGRCRLPNTNQITGVKHPSEPDKTLKSFRCIDQGLEKDACLGMQMVPALEDSYIKIEDQIEVLETGEHFYIKQ